jgi:hypothetical protein
MGKFIWGGFYKPGDVIPQPVSFLTGSNLRQNEPDAGPPTPPVPPAPPPAPREPFLTDAAKEEFLAQMRRDHGEQWVRDNWERLEAEWAYIQSW